jgi:hypothetical protein
MTRVNSRQFILRAEYPHQLLQTSDVMTMGWNSSRSRHANKLLRLYLSSMGYLVHSYLLAPALLIFFPGLQSLLHCVILTSLNFLAPPLLFLLLMPRQRGKSKRGSDWYNSQRCDHRHKPDLQTPFAHSSTLDLPPLSSPWACRVEWFDNLGYSLGYAPELNEEVTSTQLPPSCSTTLTTPPSNSTSVSLCTLR